MNSPIFYFRSKATATTNCCRAAGRLLACATVAISLWQTSGNATAEVVRVSIENVNGATFNTPVFAGFHDGSFDLFDPNVAASSQLEALAEDGANGALATQFAAAGFVGGTVGGGPFGPGSTVTSDFTIDLAGNQRLLLASMLLPTNDWFLSANDPNAFDLSGLSNGPLTFELNRLYDAGTEVNDFATSAGNPLLNVPGGQTGPNQGPAENGVVDFLGIINTNGELVSNGNVIADPFAAFGNLPANFNPALSSLRVTVSQVSSVPEPSSMAALAIVGLIGFRRRRRNTKRISA